MNSINSNTDVALDEVLFDYPLSVTLHKNSRISSFAITMVLP
jgi:hypothetical protein